MVNESDGSLYAYLQKLDLAAASRMNPWSPDRWTYVVLAVATEIKEVSTMCVDTSTIQ
ncbi:MAG: hypothetical protein ABR903_10800 [Thermodesulfovibrionales bacterium]